MKKTLIILFLVCTTNQVFSQLKPDYDIYLLFNSEKKEMRIYTFSVDDSIYKIFTFSKVETKNKYKYALFINEKGEVKKGVIGTTSWPCCSLSLKYVSSKNKKLKILKTEASNIINHGDLIDTKFSNFLEILKKSNTVYIIDSSEEKKTFIILHMKSFFNLKHLFCIK